MSRMKTYPAPDLIVRQQCQVGESPIWLPDAQSLAWVDLLEGTITSYSESTGVVAELANAGTSIGAIAALDGERSGFAVASGLGFGYAIDGRLKIEHDVLPSRRFRMNDAKPDARGRLWAGSTELDFAEAAGALHVWSGAAPGEPVASGWTLPNGLGWNPANTRMYVVDSMRGAVFSADFDLDDGVLGEFVEAFRIDGGLPDGMAVDADGCLWIAMWGGSAVRRYTPTGELIGSIATAVSQPSSCAFGDDGVLYITSARAGLSADALPREQLAGSVFAVDVGVPGLTVGAFAGTPVNDVAREEIER
ncbi:SMP-30/gluconolactonase/LRE family protein [uncultured Microbacterium sp.]|uniref:SMP-30/gluconolactonase/LRE family protein n=1 Tax=uncultured Microbacterium sp. TaxID=191216 RepID=UPI0035CA2BD8